MPPSRVNSHPVRRCWRVASITPSKNDVGVNTVVRSTRSTQRGDSNSQSYRSEHGNSAGCHGRLDEVLVLTGNGSCVEVKSPVVRSLAVRDSKVEDGPVLAFPADSWNAFVAEVSRGAF